MLLNLIPVQLYDSASVEQVQNFLQYKDIDLEYVGSYSDPTALMVKLSSNGLGIPIKIETVTNEGQTFKIGSMSKIKVKIESIIGEAIDPTRVYYVSSSARTYFLDLNILNQASYLSINDVIPLDFQFEKTSQIGRQLFIFDFPNNEVRYGLGSGGYATHSIDLSNPSQVYISFGWGEDVDLSGITTTSIGNSSEIRLDQGFIGGIYDEGSAEFTSFENKRYYQYAYDLEDINFEDRTSVTFYGDVSSSLGNSIGSASGADINVKPEPFIPDQIYSFSTPVSRRVNVYDDGRVEGYQFYFTGKLDLTTSGQTVQPYFEVKLTNQKGQVISEETITVTGDAFGNFTAIPSKFWQKTILTERNVDFSDVQGATLDVKFVNIAQINQVAMRLLNHGLRDPYLTFRDVKFAAFNLLVSYNVTEGIDFTQILNSRVVSLEAVDPYEINPETGEYYAKNTKCVLEGKTESGWTNTTTIYYDRIDFADVCSGLFFFGQISDWENRTIHQFLREYNLYSTDAFINPEDFVDGPLTGPFGRDVLLVVGNNSLVFKAGSTGTLGDRDINPVAQYDGMKVNGFLNINEDLRYVNVLYRGLQGKSRGIIKQAAIGYASWIRQGISYATMDYPPGFSPVSPYIAFAAPEKFISPSTYRGEISLYSSRTENGTNNDFVMSEEKSFCVDFFIKPNGATFTDMKCVWVGCTGFAIGSIGVNNAIAYYYKNPTNPITIPEATDEETYVRIVKEKNSNVLKIYFNDVLVVSDPGTTGIFPRVGVINIGGCYQGSGSNNWSSQITSNPENTLNFKIAEVRVMTGFDVPPSGVPTSPLTF